jgi:AGZA family xanthine/uracil permease-like MFS transporter
MMAGVGVMLANVALGMAKKNQKIGFFSIAVSFVVYMMTKDLVYTVTISVVGSSILALALKQKTDMKITGREKLVFQKPIFNLSVFQGAMALICLNIGANIAFGEITGSIAKTEVNIDHLSIVSSLADLASASFGGGPVESIISAKYASARCSMFPNNFSPFSVSCNTT